MRVNLSEMIHVYEDHTATDVALIAEDFDDYSKNEIIKMAQESAIEMNSFLELWLKPATEELKQLRKNQLLNE